MTRLLGSGGTSLKGLSSLNNQNVKGGEPSATPQGTKNEDANTLQSLQSVDHPGTAGSLSQTPPVQKPQGLTRKIQAKLITPRKPPKIVERRAAAVTVMTFPRLPTMSDNSLYSQMRQDIRQMGFTQETLNDFIPSRREEEGNLMLYDGMKNEGGQKKVLPTRTMSLASLQPYEDRDSSKVLPVFPKLVAKQLKPKRVDKMKKISRQEYFEEKRALASYDKQALASLLDPNFLHTEKAHFILLDKSNPNYKAMTRPKGGAFLEDGSTSDRRGLDHRSSSAPRGINFNFDADSYRLNDVGPIKTLQSNNSKTILPTNYISEIGADESPSHSGGSIVNTSQEKITVGKARTMNQLPQASGRNSDSRSLSPEAKILDAIDFNHTQSAVEKKGPLSDQDIESLYNFLRSDVNSAGQKVSLLKRALGQSKEGDGFGDPVLQMEDQLRDILVLKNRAVFKSTINEWLGSHVACGKKCNHLRAFYRQSGFTKEFEQRQKGVEKKSLKPTTAQFSKTSNLI